VAEVELKDAGGIPYREAVPGGDPAGASVLLVHGFPESSRMWEPLMGELGAARRCVAPDLYCLGDSRDPGPATFERNLETLGALHEELGLAEVILIVHDWGGFVGLAWACNHPDLVKGLVISDTGFFSDGRWHGLAEAVRGEEGEKLLGALDRDGFASLLRGDGAQFSEEDVDAYWKPFEAGRGREATLEFYRSMDFSKLEPYDGRLAELDVPALLLWGAEDEFAPLGGAKRFERELPRAELVALEGVGHFVFDQEPGRSAVEVTRFLESVPA
jgi:haloalkane dehalogenase